MRSFELSKKVTCHLNKDWNVPPENCWSSKSWSTQRSSRRCRLFSFFNDQSFGQQALVVNGLLAVFGIILYWKKKFRTAEAQRRKDAKTQRKTRSLCAFPSPLLVFFTNKIWWHGSLNNNKRHCCFLYKSFLEWREHCLLLEFWVEVILVGEEHQQGRLEKREAFAPFFASLRLCGSTWSR